jgi:S-DNA-T family DNA segregation ATPase FtsK/SpoIIIE
MAARGKRVKAPSDDRRLTYEIAGIMLLALAALMLMSFYVQTGVIGNLVGGALAYLTGGQGRYGVVLAVAYFGICLTLYRRPLKKAPRAAGVLLSLLLFLAGVHFILPVSNLTRSGMISSFWNYGKSGLGGGILGALLCMAAVYLFARTGTIILMAACAVIALVLLTGVPLIKMLQGFGSGIRRGGHGIGQRILDFMFVEEELPAEGEGLPGVGTAGDDRSASGAAQASFGRGHVREEHGNHSLPVIIDYNAPVAALKEEEQMAASGQVQSAQQMDGRLPAASPGHFFPGQLHREMDGNAGSFENYSLPPLSLLTKPLRVKSSRLNKEILENVRILEETLNNFGVQVCVSQVHRGPAITRYEVQPAPGIKVSKIVRLADDIALSLAAPDVRIEAPIPGKAALGIEVPNREVLPVYLREILECPEFMDAASKITIALGKDIAGNPIIADLMKMPHLLIAGATGSGKSVCLNAIITSILYKATPDDVKFVMIDPKMVELITYNGIPHLLSPVVIDPRRAASALKWVVGEMENRYELFASLGIRDITRYNSMCREQGWLHEPLPLIVVVIDELADLMLIAPIEVEDLICRLAQMARAAGIHLVVATQRPSVDVITGLIKANIPTRIAFAVSSQTDSRTILDLNGAEKLLGKGDMLFLPVGATKPIRIQGTLVTDGEIEGIVKYILKQGQPQYIANFPEQAQASVLDKMFEDELFADAARLVMEQGHASISLLQRRFRIGYARAGRLMDILEERGIVGPYDGARPRDVLMTSEQFNRYYGKKTSERRNQEM